MVLCFGLIRPYKGVDVLLEAFRSVEGAELWVVGRPLGVSLDHLRELASRAPGTVGSCPDSCPTASCRPTFAAPTWWPSRTATPSSPGVLYAALAFGKPIVLSDVGGFARSQRTGSGASCRRATRRRCGGDRRPARRSRGPRATGRRRAGAAAGPYSWDAVAEQTLALYRELSG